VAKVAKDEIKKAVLDTEDKKSAEKKSYSEEEYKGAIENAARHAASEAIDHIRAVDEEDADDKKILKGELKKGGKKKTKKDPATEIKKAVKSAVIKSNGENAKLQEGKSNGGKNLHGVDVITSM
jgi:hypothetical protein